MLTSMLRDACAVNSGLTTRCEFDLGDTGDNDVIFGQLVYDGLSWRIPSREVTVTVFAGLA